FSPWFAADGVLRRAQPNDRAPVRADPAPAIPATQHPAPGMLTAMTEPSRPDGSRAPKVPAADGLLRVLTFLAAQQRPVPVARIAADPDLPRSRTYDLLAVMVEHGYALHLPAERQYALG